VKHSGTLLLTVAFEHEKQKIYFFVEVCAVVFAVAFDVAAVIVVSVAVFVAVVVVVMLIVVGTA
jgi:hypothetical protein